MAKLQFEERQVSILNPQSLPNVTAHLEVPDIAGPTRRLAAAFMGAGTDAQEKADRQKAYDDLMAGREAGMTAKVGISADGVYTPIPKANGSLEYQKGHDAAIEQTYSTAIEADLFTQLLPIQTDPKLSAADKAVKMAAAVDGMLTKVPPRLQQHVRDFGMDQVRRRTELVISQEAERARVLTIDAQKATIEKATADAGGLVAAGGNPAAHLEKISQSYDNLVNMGAISKENGDAMKAQAIQIVTADGVSRRLVDATFAGEIAPDKLSELAVKIKAGGEAEIIIDRSEPGDRPNRPVIKAEGYKASDLQKAIPDQELRNKLAVNLNAAANERQQHINSQAKGDDFMATFKSLGPFQRLPTYHTDDLNKWIDKVVIQGKAMDTPEGRKGLIEVISQAKRVPNAVLDNIRGKLQSGDPADLDFAVAFYQRISKAQDRDGNMIGDILVSDIPDGVRRQLETASLGRELGMPAADVQTAMKAAGQPNAATMKDTIDRFNMGKTEAEEGFEKSFFLKWTNEKGPIPSEAEQQFREAYHFNVLVTNDPRASFDKAFETVSKLYTTNKLFIGGTAKTGRADLTNPAGFEVSRTDMFGNPGRDTEYEWIDDFVREELKDMETSLSVDELADILNQPQAAAHSIFLQPTDTNSAMPEFNVIVQHKDGTREAVMVEGPNGNVRRMTINPHLARAQAEDKFRSISRRTELDRAAAEAQQQLQNKLVPPTWSTIPMPFEDFIKTQPPEVQEKYRLDSEGIRMNLQKAIDEQNKLRGTPVPPGTVGDQSSLMIPKGAGEPIVNQVVATVESVLPDGTGGAFMRRVAAQESEFGHAEGTYRASGDKGIWQVNTGSGFVEIKRRVALGQGRVFEAAQRVKDKLGIDVASVTEADLDKPLVAGVMARLYFMAATQNEIPKDLEGQALHWKKYYNTSAGDGTPDQFIASAGKLSDVRIEPVSFTSFGSKEGFGVTDMSGKPDPAHFRSMDRVAQAGLTEISSAFGEPLRMTPHGGRSARASSTSQHGHGLAGDVYIADMPDDRKTQLLATAIAKGATGIGGYGAGDGKGTLHFDFRKSKGKGPGGLATWWRHVPGKDSSWTTAPAWFRRGIEQGLRMRDGESV